MDGMDGGAGVFILRSLFSCPCLHVLQKLGCVVLEKVELHGNGDSQNQVGIQGWFIEYFVDMVAGAMDGARQPTHAAVVGLQLFADEVSDVDVAFGVFHCFWVIMGFSPFPCSNEIA